MICFLVLLLCLQPSEEKSVTVLKIGFQVFEKALNIFKTGRSIADFFNKKETDPGITEEDLARLKDDILQEVEQMLAISESNIILVLTLQEEVGRLKDIVSVVRSSLADLDLYFKATNGTEEDYKKLYQNRFEEHDVIVQIRKLPTLLSDTVPELSKPLKYLILDTTKCNMTSIVEFEYFYANLISHAITLQFAYTEFANLNIDFVQEYWDTNLDQVQVNGTPLFLCLSVCLFASTLIYGRFVDYHMLQLGNNDILYVFIVYIMYRVSV